MRQIITLEKEIAFKTMVGEVSSISLEPDLSFINDSEIEGNLIVSGTYKLTEASTIEEDFNYKVPVEIPELQKCTNMPNKWIELIHLGYKYMKTYH